MAAPYKGTQSKGTKGFKRTSTLLTDRIRRASEKRGFAETRILTHWEEIVGEAIAAIARPVDVSYGRGGFGATLSILTTGAQAPVLEMQKEDLRNRINAVYGYNAIARIRITQTAPTGFDDGHATFDGPKAKPVKQPDAQATDAARNITAPVGDDSLRDALEKLGQNVLTRTTN